MPESKQSDADPSNVGEVPRGVKGMVRKTSRRKEIDPARANTKSQTAWTRIKRIPGRFEARGGRTAPCTRVPTPVLSGLLILSRHHLIWVPSFPPTARYAAYLALGGRIGQKERSQRPHGMATDTSEPHMKGLA